MTEQEPRWRVLPRDVARCGGNPIKVECDTCLRKLSPPNRDSQTWIGFWILEERCPYRIPLDDAAS